MTEAEWSSCNDLYQMLIYLRGEVEPAEEEPDRRPRLIGAHGDLVFGSGNRVTASRLGRFAQLCCEKWWELPLDEGSCQLVLGYERFLTGEGSWESFCSSCSELWEAAKNGRKPLVYTMAAWHLNPYGIAMLEQDLAWVTACYHNRDRIEELERTASEDELFAWGYFGYDFPEFNATATAFREPFPAWLREVVGNPFQFSPSLPAAVLTWNDGIVKRIARSIDAEQAFERLPILADALLDAGCENAELLAHCQKKGGHVRGCWALDVILEQS